MRPIRRRRRGLPFRRPGSHGPLRGPVEINPAGPDFEKKPGPMESGLIWAGPRPRMGMHGPAAPEAPLPRRAGDPAVATPAAPGAAPSAPAANAPPREPGPRKPRLRAVTSRETWLDRIFLVDLLEGILFGGAAIAFVITIAASGGQITPRLLDAAPIIASAAALIALGVLVKSGRNWAFMIQWLFTAPGLLSIVVYFWHIDMPIQDQAKQLILIASLVNTAFSIAALILLIKATKAPRTLLVPAGGKGPAPEAAAPVPAPEAAETLEDASPPSADAEPIEELAEEPAGEAEPEAAAALVEEAAVALPDEAAGDDEPSLPDGEDLLGEIASLDADLALGDGSLPAEEPEAKAGPAAEPAAEPEPEGDPGGEPPR